MRVASTRQVRGTVERSYALSNVGALSQKTFDAMSGEEWQRAFALFTSTVQAEFASFIDSHPVTTSRPWNFARMNEIRATPDQLRSAINQALERLSKLEEEQVGGDTELLSYRIAVVGFPLDSDGASS